MRFYYAEQAGDPRWEEIEIRGRAVVRHTGILYRFPFQSERDEWVAAGQNRFAMAAVRACADYGTGLPSTARWLPALGINAEKFVSRAS